MNKITSDATWVDDLMCKCLDASVPAAVESQLRVALRKSSTNAERFRSVSISRRRVLIAATAAAAGGIALGVPMFSNATPQAWGQVTTHVRQMPWVHFSGVHFNGDSMEFWVSFKDQVFAAKFGDTEFAHFQRASDSKTCSYRESEKLLIEEVYRPMPGEFGHLEHLFSEMTTGAAISNLSGPDEIVSQTNRVVNVDRAQRWEYEFRIRAFDEGREDTYTVLFLVDPSTKLPVQWSRYRDIDGKRLIMQIDYPDGGPTSIFDLGVPVGVERKQRSVKVLP